MREKFIVTIDGWDGPYDNFAAAEFVARDLVKRFAEGEVKGFRGRKRKAVIARVVDVVDYNPGSWWDRATGGKGAA